MTDWRSILFDFGLGGAICGLGWIWCRTSARAELRRLRAQGSWRVPGEEGRAFLIAQVFVVAAVVLTAGLGNWRVGLFAWLPFPLVLRLGLGWQRRRALVEMERTCLVSLHALKGFLESGLGLSASLFLLGEKQRLEFSRKLAKTLRHFDRGETLEGCLRRFLRRTPSPRVGQVVGILLTGYASGLPLVPFLEHGVGVMERHRRSEARIGRVRGVAAAQGAFAALLPWGLLAYLSYTQETAFFSHFRDPFFLLLAVLCLLAEGAGLVVLWRLARFS